MIRCPKCGQPSQVLYGRVNAAGTTMTRRRKCRACGGCWSTVEAFAPRKSRPLSRHGIIVPPELEADWRTYLRNGFTALEAAQALNIPVPEALTK